jgi:hypothetical protein
MPKPKYVEVNTTHSLFFVVLVALGVNQLLSAQGYRTKQSFLTRSVVFTQGSGHSIRTIRQIRLRPGILPLQILSIATPHLLFLLAIEGAQIFGSDEIGTLPQDRDWPAQTTPSVQLHSYG